MNNYKENEENFQINKKKEDQRLLGHPIGLFILFFMEMWERFSFYGMKAILVLYLIKKHNETINPGLGWSEKEALSLYGWYNMFVYFSGLLGGYIGDLKSFGQLNTIKLGCFIQMTGHFLLIIKNISAFYFGLTFIIIGCGMLKPNISTIVGRLYDQNDKLRDQGFTIFYIGINMGAFFASIIVGYVGEQINWNLGFGLAAIGMLVAQITFYFGQKYIHLVECNNTDQANKYQQEDYDELTNIEKDRIKLIILVYIISIIFWGAFEQGGGLISIFISQKTDKKILKFEIPTSWFQALNPLFIIILGKHVSSFWLGLKKNYSDIYKMGMGVLLTGTGFIFMIIANIQYNLVGHNSMVWIILTFLLHTVGELCFSPVVLSFITRMSPQKYQSKFMGLYFAMTGFGGKLAGYLGEVSSAWGTNYVFIIITLFTYFLAFLMFCFENTLLKYMHQDYHQDSHYQELNG